MIKFYFFSWSALFLLTSFSFAVFASSKIKKEISIVHTENLITILGGEPGRKSSDFNTYKVYTMRRKSLKTLFLSYVKIKINRNFFRVKLSDLNHFLEEMSPSLKVHTNFLEKEITNRFNKALQIFKRKLHQEKRMRTTKHQEPSETKALTPKTPATPPPERPLCQGDIEIVDLEEGKPVKYLDLLTILKLRQSPADRETEARERCRLKQLEEGNRKLEETKTVIEELQKHYKEALLKENSEKARKKKASPYKVTFKSPLGLQRI